MEYCQEKYNKGKKYPKPALKALISLKNKLETCMDEQFESAIKTGDFS